MADKVINGSLDVTGEISQNGHSIAPQINVTWAELKVLRDGGTLVPGQQYRITDYTCTTSQENTSSAGHQFDVIVTADSENVLNEDARACLHVGDTYFANCKLESWELKYCLDNDANRFEWAAPSGKGVIYWMKDEGGNEVPYDFKNIMFVRNLNDGFIVAEGGDIGDVYTFTYSDVDTGEIKDASVIYRELFDDARANIGVRNNIIKSCISESSNTGTPCSTLSNIVVFCNSYYDGGLFYGIIGNHFGFGCHEITLQDYCMYNEFGNSCSNIFFYSDSQHNVFLHNVHNISVGQYVYHNYFYPACTDLDLTRGSIYYSVFDSDCDHLTITALEDGNIRHIHVHSGVRNKTITVSTLNSNHSIDYYAPNSETIML